MATRKCYKLLLIGQSGAGKTSFLNLLYNLEKIRSLKGTFGLDIFSRCHDLALERVPQDPMESKTTKAKEYHIQLGDFDVHVTDTPGFGDTQGAEKDEEHMRTIQKVAHNVKAFDCCCLIINGRQPRATLHLQKAFEQISNIFNGELTKCTIVILTNVQKLRQASIDEKLLLRYTASQSMDDFYCIENPYSLVEKMNQLPEMFKDQELVDSLKKDMKASEITVKRLIQRIHSLQRVEAKIPHKVEIDKQKSCSKEYCSSEQERSQLCNKSAKGGKMLATMPTQLRPFIESPWQVTLNDRTFLLARGYPGSNYNEKRTNIIWFTVNTRDRRTSYSSNRLPDESFQKCSPYNEVEFIARTVNNVLQLAERCQICSLDIPSSITIDMELVSRGIIDSIFDYPFTVKPPVLGIIKIIVNEAQSFPSFVRYFLTRVNLNLYDTDVTNDRCETCGRTHYLSGARLYENEYGQIPSSSDIEGVPVSRLDPTQIQPATMCPSFSCLPFSGPAVPTQSKKNREKVINSQPSPMNKSEGADYQHDADSQQYTQHCQPQQK